MQQHWTNSSSIVKLIVSRLNDKQSTNSVFSIVELVLSSFNDQLSSNSLSPPSSIVDTIFSPLLDGEYRNFLFIRRWDERFPIPRRTIDEFSFYPSWKWSFVNSSIEIYRFLCFSMVELIRFVHSSYVSYRFFYFDPSSRWSFLNPSIVNYRFFFLSIVEVVLSQSLDEQSTNSLFSTGMMILCEFTTRIFLVYDRYHSLSEQEKAINCFPRMWLLNFSGQWCIGRTKILFSLIDNDFYTLPGDAILRETLFVMIGWISDEMLSLPQMVWRSLIKNSMKEFEDERVRRW